MNERAPAIGCMRLSTETDRDEERSISVLCEALSAGVRLLDTADAYALDAADVGHNERLLRRALGAWSGDRSAVRVATKGGLTRPGGKWIPSGKAGHLRKACEASLAALGVSRVDVYQLHLVDPRTPLAVSVRALAALQREGLAAEVGLCNVSVAQIEEARGIVDVASVQVRLGPLDTAAIRSGVVSYCLSCGIRVLAYRPFGGAAGVRRVRSEPVLAESARRRATDPLQIALAWMLDLSPLIVPLPGPTSVETARACALAARIELTDEDRAALDARFPEGAAIRRGEDPSARRPAMVPVPSGPRPQIAMVLGYPGAGKSTATMELTEQGYLRLNRDERGGRLAGIALALDHALQEGARHVVLDNTYSTRALRREVLDVAARHGAEVKVVWIDTSLEQAQVNACERMVARYGRLLSPEEMASGAKQDPNSFPPRAQFQYRRALEPPDESEGFVSVERRPFVRRADPSRQRRALFVELDSILWKSRSGERTPASPDDMDVMVSRANVLKKYSEGGHLLVALSWQPEIAENKRAPDAVERCFEALCRALGVEMSLAYCPHGGGPPICWCRKPMPGMGVALAHAHGIDLARSLHVGKGPPDRAFAERLGMVYEDADVFFGS
jgi:aryl-alcohol dehydrogenase-like predicted oxidoreductase/histidinol phosphatase-like enzyme/adenylate kinase family enzyme